MRLALVALAVFVAVSLGTIQGCSDVALREHATRISVSRLVPAAIVRSVASQDPQKLQPLIMRYVLGGWAIDRGDVARGSRFADSLPLGPDRDLLEAGVFEARGDRAMAIEKYIDSGDASRLERRIDERVAAGHVFDALSLQRALLARLSQQRAQNDTIAEATYREGVIDQDVAYTFASGTELRDRWQRRSRDAYATASTLAPLEDRYALALGNQELNLDDLAAARAAFLHVRDLDPASVDPLTGLADAAIRAHDFATASAYLDRANALAPGSPAVARMRARLPHA